MRAKLCFVQFPHPGGEHRPPRGASTIEWNQDAHRRKFVVSPGRALPRTREAYDAQLAFWTEWEPESDVVEEFENPHSGGPQFIWRPYYQIPERYRRHQNSDPLVFGGFYYSSCRQWTAKGPTQLRFLKPGSVILFGSGKEGDSVMDTCFVVAWHLDFRPGEYKALDVPQVLRDVTLAPLAAHENACGRSEFRKSGCGTGGPVGFRLYFGATHDEPFEGMFSFFPCTRFAPGSGGFARPAIALPGIVNPASKQGIRLNPQAKITDARRLWDSVVDQVFEQGLDLGIRAAEPPRRSPGCAT